MNTVLSNSADSHVVEPKELWLDTLAPPLRERAPQTTTEVRNGRPYEVISVDGRAVRYEPPGFQDDMRPPGAFEATARLKDLQSEGIWAELLFPSVGLWCYLIESADLAIASARIYNDWLRSAFLQKSRRFVGAAMIPLVEIEDAIGEIRRTASLGFKTALLPCTPPKAAYNEPRYEPLWQVLDETGMYPSLHVGTGSDPIVTRGPGGAIINYVETAFPMQRAVLNFVAAGVFDRFPKLKLLCVEGGASWLPGLVERMDEAYRQHSKYVRPKLSRPPAQMIREHVCATFQHDKAFLSALEVIGVDAVMWGSDYPHIEGTWPNSQKTLDGIFAGVSTEVRNKVTRDTFASLFPDSQVA
jgi:predicted TIM-barrel fold metal-dependent hydrolase